MFCQALLRRLQKRVYVGLPDHQARSHLLARLLGDRLEPGVCTYAATAGMDGFSGADIVCVAKEAAMRQVRLLLKDMESGMRSSAQHGAPSAWSAHGLAVRQEDLVKAA